MEHLNEHLPADAIVTNGAGNYTFWPQRYHQVRTYPSQLGPQVGSMGYGLPAALAAKALYPERAVVAFAGDGCFLMNGQELATATRHGMGILVLVFNNGTYGTIRTHQEQKYPGHAYGTDLVNPDFAAYARAFGAHGEVVRRTDEFPAALERALASGGPALIELRMSETRGP
jgi:acetolactate synthase-1/2/3 large subunit